MTIAIIGAGVAGLSAARELRANGKTVRLFDKSRGVSGRMSTRYADAWEFDHGAQYFTVQDADFRAEIETAMSAGACAPWPARALYLRTGELTADIGRDRYVGTPRMNSLAKYWAEGLEIDLGRRVVKIKRGETWSLQFEDGTVESSFEGIISTLPPAQAALVLPVDFMRKTAVEAAEMYVCFTLMIGLSASIDPGWDTLRVKNLPIDWISINSAKPGRSQDVGAIVVTSTPEWSDLHQNADRGWVQETMIKSASALLGLPLEKVPHIALHRWLYASNKTSPDVECLAEDGLAVCGDWCLGGRVQGAWLSGRAAARTFL